MLNNLDLVKFLDKIKKNEKGHVLDLSIGEDLSIAIMNLISIEEHLLFTGNKTGDNKYFDLLSEARKMRVDLLKQIIKDPKGELWCTSKHLLAASMRLFEVGTKYQTKGDKKTAYDFFKKSFNLYNLFWGLNLDMVKSSDISKKEIVQEKNPELKKSDFFGKINGVIGKILDCCRE
jgi:hypothetical protein